MLTRQKIVTHVKRKCSRPPKHKTEEDKIQKPAANTCTTQPRQANENSKK